MTCIYVDSLFIQRCQSALVSTLFVVLSTMPFSAGKPTLHLRWFVVHSTMPISACIYADSLFFQRCKSELVQQRCIYVDSLFSQWCVSNASPVSKLKFATIGPLAKSHFNGVSLVGLWWAAGGPRMLSGWICACQNVLLTVIRIK